MKPHEPGDSGLEFMELSGKLDVTANLPVALATGTAGTVYLCYPFLVHAAQRNLGGRPRFIAQPPLLDAEPLRLDRNEGDHAPIEAAIRVGLGLPPATRSYR